MRYWALLRGFVTGPDPPSLSPPGNLRYGKLENLSHQLRAPLDHAKRAVARLLSGEVFPEDRLGEMVEEHFDVARSGWSHCGTFRTFCSLSSNLGRADNSCLES